MRRDIVLTLAFLLAACEGLPFLSPSPNIARCIKRDSNDNLVVPYNIHPSVAFRKENIEFIHNNVYSKAFPNLRFLETTYDRACINYVNFSHCSGSAAGCSFVLGTHSFIYVSPGYQKFSDNLVFRQTVTDFSNKLGSRQFDSDTHNKMTAFQYNLYSDASQNVDQYTLRIFIHEIMHAFNFGHISTEEDSVMYSGSTGRQFYFSYNDWIAFYEKWGKNYPWFSLAQKQEFDWQVVPARNKRDSLPFTPSFDNLPELFQDVTQSPITKSPTTKSPTTQSPITKSPITQRNLQATDWKNEYRRLVKQMSQMLLAIQKLMTEIHPNMKITHNRQKSFNHHAKFDGEGVKVRYVSGSFDEEPSEIDIVEKKNVRLNVSGNFFEVIDAPVYESMNQVLVLEPKLTDDLGSAFIFRQNLKRIERKLVREPHLTSGGHVISFS